MSEVINEALTENRLNAPRTTSVKDVLFAVLRNRRVSHQFQHTTRVSSNCSKVAQGIFVIHTVFNSCLVLDRNDAPFL